MAEQAPQFFAGWQNPPQYAPAPAAEALAQRILKLAQFASRNGPSFVDLIRTKQQGNLEYAFLFNGEGSDYYHWVLYCHLYNVSMDRSVAAPVSGTAPAASVLQTLPSPQAPHAAASESGMPMPAFSEQPGGASWLPPEVDQGLDQLLTALTGSKESIRQSQEWFMACLPHCDGMARKIAAHVRSSPDYAHQLLSIYLTNDILLKSVKAQQAGEAGRVAHSFLPLLPGMLAATYVRGGQSEEVRGRLQQIIDHWQTKGVFDQDTTAAMTTAMLTGDSIAAPDAVTQAPSALSAPRVRPRARWDDQGGPQAPPQPAAPPQQAQHAQHAQHAQQAEHAQQAQQQYGQQQYDQYGQLAYSQGVAYPQQGVYPGGGVPQPYPMLAQMPAQHAYPNPQHWGMQAESFGGQQAAWGSAALNPGMAGVAAPPYMGGMPQADTWGIIPAESTMIGQHPAAAAGPLPPVPKDPMSFPPGLIPQLVRDKLRSEAPYSPLSTLEVEAAGMPAQSEPDAYLKARIQRFYAELQNYHPGVLRADVEADQRRQRRLEGRTGGENEDGPARRQGSQRGPAADSGTGQHADGSFSQAGANGSKATGLGFSPPAEQPSSYGTVYDSFRSGRSGRYHDNLAKNQFAAAASRGST